MLLNTPIIFIIFNRPETTRIVFEEIRKIKPSKLYVIADAPRENNEADITKCKEARDIVQEIDWPCELIKKYADINLGCGKNISEGISWVFEREEMAIILEDDCLPALSFFYYAEELLMKYKNDQRIMHIGGTNWHPEYKHNEAYSYFFSKDVHVWGWATWRRAWKWFDYEMKDYPKFIESNEYKKIILNKNEQKYFKLRWDSFYKTNYKMHQGSNWDYQWYFTVLKKRGLSIWPKSNLISNIGTIGTHTSTKELKLHFREVSENYKINIHPKTIAINTHFDLYHYYKHKHVSLLEKILNRISKYLKK